MQNEHFLTLAEHFGTPLFVYDAGMVLERYNDLKRFIDHPRLELHYALKANFNPALLTLTVRSVTKAAISSILPTMRIRPTIKA